MTLVELIQWCAKHPTQTLVSAIFERVGYLDRDALETLAKELAAIIPSGDEGEYSDRLFNNLNEYHEDELEGLEYFTTCEVDSEKPDVFIKYKDAKDYFDWLVENEPGTFKLCHRRKGCEDEEVLETGKGREE